MFKIPQGRCRAVRSRGVVAGGGRWSSGLPSAAFWSLIPAQLATSSRPPAAPFAVRARPPCVLLPRIIPGQPRPAGQPLQSFRSPSSLLSPRARPRAGIRSGVGGGKDRCEKVGNLTASSRDQADRANAQWSLAVDVAAQPADEADRPLRRPPDRRPMKFTAWAIGLPSR